MAVNTFFESVNAILNLCAPGAFIFDVPWALSFNELSSSGVVKLSVVVNPTLNVGVLEYASSINVSSLFFTKKPFMKYTPSSTFTALALPVAFELVGNEVPDVPTTAVKAVPSAVVPESVSPSENLFDVLFVPVFVYVT